MSNDAVADILVDGCPGFKTTCDNFAQYFATGRTMQRAIVAKDRAKCRRVRRKMLAETGAKFRLRFIALFIKISSVMHPSDFSVKIKIAVPE